MRSLVLYVLALAGGPVAYGQLESNTLTVTVTRSVTLQPDQAVFSIIVSAPPLTTLDEIVAVLQPAGITAANLDWIGNGSAQNGQLLWDWAFSLAVPIDKIAETQIALSRLTQRSELTIRFSVSGAEASQELRSLSCPAPELIAEARSQAQKLATTAGSTLGPILSIGNAPALNAARSVIIADFVLGVPPRPIATCSLAVKFKLGG